VKDSWPEGNPGNKVIIEELVTTTRDAYAALWSFCLGLDLSATIEGKKRPPDEPLRWMLVEPRRLRVTRSVDDLWSRLVDIPAALAARRYGIEGRLVLEILDSFMPDNTGRYQLAGGPDGAECRPTRESADLRMDVSDLGALYLGGPAPSLLARAGRIEECRAKRLAHADLMFVSRPEPWCSTSF